MGPSRTRSAPTGPSCPLHFDRAGKPVESARRRVRRRDADDARRYARIDLRREHRLATALADLDLCAFVDAEVVEQRAVHARAWRPRVRRLLQGRRAAHEWIGKI